MKHLPPTYTIENFFSMEEIDKICSSVFENQDRWKSASEYPNFLEKKSNFNSYKTTLRKILKEITKFKVSPLNSNSIKFYVQLIRQYHEKNKLLSDNFFTNYIKDDDFMEFIVERAIKSFDDNCLYDDKILEKTYYDLFSTDKFQNMFGDAIYLIDGKKDFIDWDTQRIIRTEFSWVYEKLVNKFKDIFSEEVIVHPDLPSPGFHIFSLFESCEEKELKFQYHKDINVLDYYPDVDINTIYSFVSLIKSPEIKPFVEFLDYGRMHYEYGNLYLWKGALTHKIGQMCLKPKEYRITLQGHLFFDEDQKCIKLFF